jgi:hypothetical protein
VPSLFGALLTAALGCGDVQTTAPGDPAEVPDEDAAAEPPADAGHEEEPDTDAAPEEPGLPAEGLLAAYEFDQAGEEVMIDDSGNGHDAVCMPDCPALTGDRDGTGQAARFGEGSFLRIGADAAFQTSEGFTVAAWLNVQELSSKFGGLCAVCKPLGSGVLNSWMMLVEVDGRPLFLSMDGIADQRLFGEKQIAVNVWTHLAITWDGSSKKVWIDARVVGESQASVELDDGAIIIGGDLDIGDFRAAFNGLIDEVRIYDRALSPEEIAELADAAS